MSRHDDFIYRRWIRIFVASEDPPFDFPIFRRLYVFASRSNYRYHRHLDGSWQKRKVSYLPRDVTEPHPLFFISWRYKRNALLISRLLAIPFPRDSSCGLLPLDQYRMIRMKRFINSRQFHICTVGNTGYQM